MEEGIKVSVIVPIYNAGTRIFHCLDTLVNQTLREIEIICVLDYPLDGTDKVVEEYARKDDRIVIIRNEHNLHVSGSRNEGMKVARGKYIGFSDHDDYRELNMYERLYENAYQTDADVVVSNAKVINEDRTIEYYYFNDFSQAALIDSCILPREDSRNTNMIYRTCWHSIYKRSFLIENAIYFEDRYRYLEEDTLFNLKVAVCAKRLFYVNEVFYCWDKHVLSESNRVLSHEEVVKRQLGTMRYVIDVLNKTGLSEHFRESEYVMISNYLKVYYNQYNALIGQDRVDFMKLLNDVHFPLWGRYNLKLFSKKRLKLFFFVLKLKWDGRKY